MDIRMDKTESSAKCRKILDDLFKPIKQKLDDNAYEGEGAWKIYHEDKEKFKTAYLNTEENLGPMKGQELDRFLERFPDQAIAEIDKAATEKAAKRQENLLKLRVTLNNDLENLKRECQIWKDIRFDNLKWLDEAPDNLVGSQTGKVAAGTTATALTVGVLLAPFTFGGSLVGAGAATAAGTALGMKLKKDALEANQKVWNELSEKLENDNASIDNVNSAIEGLARSAKALSQDVGKVDAGKGREVSSKVKVALPTIEAVESLGDMPVDKEEIVTKLKEKAEELKAHEESVLQDDPVGSMENMVDSIDDLVRPLLKRQYPSSS